MKTAAQMLAAYLQAKPKAIKEAQRRTRSKSKSTTKRDWKAIRQQQFLKQFGKELQAKYHCHHCKGPVSESMHGCPWCGTHRKIFRGETEFPAECTRCHRGLKLDWHYCPWCYGAGFEPLSGTLVHRPPLHGPLPQPQMRPQGPDALHALLSLVPHQGSAAVEDCRLERLVRQVRLGRACGSSGRIALGARRSCRSTNSRGQDASRSMLYESDLAHIHIDGYGFHWEGAAPAVLKWLRDAGIRQGKIVDVGCGGGQWLARLAEAGYEPVGVEVSPAMIRHAQFHRAIGKTHLRLHR